VRQQFTNSRQDQWYTTLVPKLRQERDARDDLVESTVSAVAQVSCIVAMDARRSVANPAAIVGEGTNRRVAACDRESDQGREHCEQKQADGPLGVPAVM
jgi:hypothetical protein